VSAGKNAVERRLDLLHDQWNEFAQAPEPRLLRWMIRADEWRMIEAFLAVESDERTGETPDLFVRLAEPFRDVDSYGAALLDELRRQYAEAADALAEEGVPGHPWEPPAPAPGTHSLLAFADGCAALQAHYTELMERLALVLAPAEVADYAEWKRWLLAAAERLPEGVRLVVVDSVEAPALEGLAAADPERVRTVAAGLDMPAAYQELARAGGTASPGGQFRVAFAALAAALGAGDLAGAERAGQGAVAVATEHGWPQLSAAVHMAMGGGFMGAGRTADAVAAYARADAAGAQAEAHGDEAGPGLRLQAALGSAGARFAAGDFAGAAAAYEGALPLAQRAGDRRMAMECWRMSAYCHEQHGDAERAWLHGSRALDAGEALPPEERALSTLPYAGEGMLRLALHSPAHAEGVERRMAALLGTRAWRPAAAAGAP
jgi:hypothetical protein